MGVPVDEVKGGSTTKFKKNPVQVFVKAAQLAEFDLAQVGQDID